jgi:ubiquinone/menaquinone biosynthesis C-methylase UbiE
VVKGRTPPFTLYGQTSNAKGIGVLSDDERPLLNVRVNNVSDQLSLPTRQLNWKSCLDRSFYPELLALQKRMEQFYKTSPDYYPAIDFSAGTWSDCSQLEAQDILNEVSRHDVVLEVGCGTSNILKSGRVAQRNYTGIDFSAEVIRSNQERYPEATFSCIKDITQFPCPTEQYTMVFSHYVLEHCVFPNKFLDESLRVLRPGGLLAILCPDFLGSGRMTSQRAGFSEGTGRGKLLNRKYWDSLITGYDNKVRIPLYAAWLRTTASKRPKFFINTNPTCFSDSFKPDVDAVYVTFAEEIRCYLANSIRWIELDKALTKYAREKSHIYLKGYKCAVGQRNGPRAIVECVES